MQLFCNHLHHANNFDKKYNKKEWSRFCKKMLKRKITLQWTFLEVAITIFKNESSIATLYSNLFKKLGQNEMKN